MRNLRRRNAFTLIELLLVMVILVVLAAVVVPKFVSRGEDARKSAAKADLKTIETQLDAFEIDNGRYPSSDEGLAALVSNPGNLPNWHGPYLNKLPVDPWGNNYIYMYPGSHTPNGFDLSTYGQDGREGNDDIVSWQE